MERFLFFLELPLSEEIVPLKFVDGVFRVLSRDMETLFLKRDPAIDLQCCEHKKFNLSQLYWYWDGGRNLKALAN